MPDNARLRLGQGGRKGCTFQHRDGKCSLFALYSGRAEKSGPVDNLTGGAQGCPSGLSIVHTHWPTLRRAARPRHGTSVRASLPAAQQLAEAYASTAQTREARGVLSHTQSIG